MKLYAIVDIETTGGNASSGSITEIAVAIHNGKEVIEFYETLVRPNQYIPYFIQQLTGITNEMVATAPTFNEVADIIYHLLKDKVFVAHNVGFDYSFVNAHLQVHGYKLNVPKLCTVKLSRKLMPGMNSYSLGKLCTEVGINHTARHRAGGDVQATAQLFAMLFEKANYTDFFAR